MKSCRSGGRAPDGMAPGRMVRTFLAPSHSMSRPEKATRSGPLPFGAGCPGRGASGRTGPVAGRARPRRRPGTVEAPPAGSGSAARLRAGSSRSSSRRGGAGGRSAAGPGGPGHQGRPFPVRAAGDGASGAVPAPRQFVEDRLLRLENRFVIRLSGWSPLRWYRSHGSSTVAGAGRLPGGRPPGAHATRGARLRECRGRGRRVRPPAGPSAGCRANCRPDRARTAA